MKRFLTLSLATCVLSLSSFVVNAGVARADHWEPCTTPEPVGVDGITTGGGGLPEIHVPGVKVQFCGSPHGHTDYLLQWLDLRVEPGTCEPSVFDPACFTLYVESFGVPYWTHFTLYTWIDGVAQDPIRVDIPPLGEPFSQCILSVGYPTAPTHSGCVRWVDLGQ